ncbi:MAG: hypothetical protein HY560_13950 [Gemmatimonadetes bacterium]|nr:hypothetical protein [Gemmatimonadota bacterium]
MSDAEKLQFDRAESVAGGSAPASCSRCKNPLMGSYYHANGAVVCEGCRKAIEAEWNRGTSATRFTRALGLGLLAAAAGSALYYAILALTGYAFGLVAIVVGLLVGFAVKKGSNGRGGWRYQALAMFLTYTSIVSSYVPLIVREVIKQQEAATDRLPGTAATDSVRAVAPDPINATSAAPLSAGGFVVGLLLMIGLLYALPFMAGLENIMGLVIIGIGLYEAWKLSQRATLTISGPYQLAR